MIPLRLANLMVQKFDAVVRRFRLFKYRILGLRTNGDVHLRKVSIPRNFHDIEIQGNTYLDDGVVLIVSGDSTGKPKIRIGKFCGFNRYTIIDASRLVEIKDYARIGPSCYITDHNHGFVRGKPIMHQSLSEAETVIGSDAWLGANVTVLKGVTIGDGAIIGAGSVVTKDILEYAIAVGNPARVIGSRTEQ